MKVFKICLGLLISVCLWAMIIISFNFNYIFNNYKYNGYKHYENVTQAATLNIFQDNCIKESLCVITGTEIYDADLEVESDKLVIKGNITINGRLKLIDTELIIEGTLIANYINIQNDSKNLKMYNYGNLTANNFSLTYSDNNFNFINQGDANINQSSIGFYSCGDTGFLKINFQTQKCIINLNTMVELFSLHERPFEITRIDKEIMIQDMTGRVIDLQTYDLLVPKDNNIYYNKIILFFIIISLFAINIISGIICMLITYINPKKSKINQLSFFEGNIFIYFALKNAFLLINILTFMLLKPYLDEIYYKWKWKNTVLKGFRMSFSGTGDQIFYKNILWVFLTFITLGIYSFWVCVKYMKWIAGSIKNDNIEINENYYTGTPKDFFHLFLYGFLRILAVEIVAIILYIVLLSCSVNFFIWILILLATLSLLLLIYCYMISKIYNHYVDITWNSINLNGNYLCCKFIRFKTFIIFFLLNFITFGGYAYIFDYILDSYLIQYS